jgi:Zn-dependent protease with chaperone function
LKLKKLKVFLEHTDFTVNQSVSNEKYNIEQKLIKSIVSEQFWKHKLVKISGNWNFILIKDNLTKEADAVTSPLLPRKIFILQGLYEQLNEDELGLILSHEIAHIICGHGEVNHIVRAILSAICIAGYSVIDPFGMGSFLGLLFDSLITSIFTIGQLSYSRECEKEADVVGTVIASMACFDVEKAFEYFKHLNNQELNQSYYSQFIPTLLKSHPIIMDRYNNLKEVHSSNKFLTQTMQQECRQKQNLYNELYDWYHSIIGNQIIKQKDTDSTITTTHQPSQSNVKITNITDEDVENSISKLKEKVSEK